MFIFHLIDLNILHRGFIVLQFCFTYRIVFKFLALFHHVAFSPVQSYVIFYLKDLNVFHRGFRGRNLSCCFKGSFLELLFQGVFFGAVSRDIFWSCCNVRCCQILRWLTHGCNSYFVESVSSVYSDIIRLDRQC